MSVYPGELPAMVPHVPWPVAEAVAPSAHSVQFYADDAVLLDDLSRYVGSALGAGAGAVIIATEPHRRGLAQRLAARGVATQHAALHGRYVELDAAETLAALTPNGALDAARFLDLIGGTIERVAVMAERRQVAAFGELVALLCAAGMPDAAIALEHLWNDLARTHAFELRCAYPMSAFGRPEDGVSLEAICAAHTHVVPVESYTMLPTEAERQRAVALLQQRALALEAEIAEHQHTARALRERNAQLRRAIATRDEFLSVAAHELKTPITSLRAYAQLLLRDATAGRAIAPARLTAGLQTIEQQTGRLGQLVARVLDTAQIEAGTLRVEPACVDLAALVQAALAARRERARQRLGYDGPAYLEAEVDPVRFDQVIANLLDNAIKFSPDGGTVTVALDGDGDGSIRLSVTDDGIGIPADQRAAVFERFRQAQRQHPLSGLGLGLYITRQIVELHGGAVWIEDPAHHGTRVVVALPRRLVDAAPAVSIPTDPA